jgi:phosphomethylpyrimidine synthase
MTHQQKPNAVTTGPVAGSHKVHSSPAGWDAIRVPFREVVLDPSAREENLRLYDTSGPYTADPRPLDRRPRLRSRPGARGQARG